MRVAVNIARGVVPKGFITGQPASSWATVVSARAATRRVPALWPTARYGTEATTREAMAPPLKGVTILDLTTALAGPSCTMYLADLGANVIKVEVPNKGDDTRNWGPPFVPHKENVETRDARKRESAYFLAVNRNKKSITVNLKTPEGIDIARKLCSQADILIENQISGKLDRLGLGYEDVKKVKKDIIYCSITGYGQTGPYRTAPGYDAVVGGEAGVINATGEPDRPPVRPGIPITDLTAGFNAAIALLAALIARNQTGKGTYIDVSMFDCQVATMANVASSYLNGGVESVRYGTAHPTVAPYQVLPTLDGYIMIGVGNDIQFQRFSQALNCPEWATSPKFRTNSDRLANRTELINLISEILSTRTIEDWRKAFTGKGFPFGSINNMQQVFSHPQAIARGLAAEVPVSRLLMKPTQCGLVCYNGERMKIDLPPPGLGQHTAEVLRGIGIEGEEKITELREMGVL